jgi:hypothetical protein
MVEPADASRQPITALTIDERDPRRRLQGKHEQQPNHGHAGTQSRIHLNPLLAFI